MATQVDGDLEDAKRVPHAVPRVRLRDVKKAKSIDVEVEFWLLAVYLYAVSRIENLAGGPVFREAVGKILALLCEDLGVAVEPMVSAFIGP